MNNIQKSNSEVSAENDTKPIVKRSVWVVYPDSVKMGLSAENTAAAWFLYSDHAYKYAKSMWEGFYIVERVVIHCV